MFFYTVFSDDFHMTAELWEFLRIFQLSKIGQDDSFIDQMSRRLKTTKDDGHRLDCLVSFFLFYRSEGNCQKARMYYRDLKEPLRKIGLSRYDSVFYSFLMNFEKMQSGVGKAYNDELVSILKTREMKATVKQASRYNDNGQSDAAIEECNEVIDHCINDNADLKTKALIIKCISFLFYF